MAKDPYLSGYGGWLAFLCVSLSILSPIFAVTGTIGELAEAERAYPALLSNPRWHTWKWVHWAAVLAICAYSFMAGNRLRKEHTPSSVIFAKRYFWVMPPVVLLHNLLLPAIIAQVWPDERSTAQVVGQAVAAAVVSAIWIRYLNVSVRVRNTYKIGLGLGSS